MQAIYETKAQAVAVASKRKNARKPAPLFTVNVTFDDADNPQVIAENVKGAGSAIEAARVWAFGAVKREAASMQDFEAVFGTRGINEAGKVVRSDEERMLSRMLNGGGMTLSVGNVTFYGTFTGYTIPQ